MAARDEAPGPALRPGHDLDALVAHRSLHYTSLNAPWKRDILRTLMLSILAG